MPSFQARTAFVVPQDGKNLNRCFPGDPDGTFSDVLAHAVFERLIAPADALLDLHGGDVFEFLEPFALYDESAVEDRASELAISFGLPFVVRSRAADAPIEGTTSAAAAAAGVPAVIAEAGGRGLLEEEAVRLLTDGVSDALRRLDMLPGEPRPPREDMRTVGRFVWLRSTSEGWWEPAVRVGEEVAESALLGAVKNLYGDIVEEIRSYRDDPGQFVYNVFDEGFFGDTPLGWEIAGDEDSVRGLSVEDIRAFWGAGYQPANLVVAAAGDLSHERVVEIIRRRYRRR